MKRAVATLVIGVLAASPVTAARGAACTSADLAPLKTAALQQELMVAALSCHEVLAYNHFVRDHQPELVDSDAALMAFFARRDGSTGVDGYNAFKTELANAASLRSAEDTQAFCDDADMEFDFVLQPASLSSIVARDRLIVRASYPACREPAATTLALADPPPQRTRPMPQRVMDADAPAPVSHDRAATISDSVRVEQPPTAQATFNAFSAPAPHRGLDAP